MFSEIKDTGAGVVLMGEAAKNWVALEWAKFYVACVLLAVLLVIVVLVLMKGELLWKQKK